MRNNSQADILSQAQELQEILLELGRKRPLRDPICQALDDLQFTPAQAHSLLWLGAEGGLTMGAIAGRLGITEKTMTGVIDRLEADGYVARARSLKDRRVVNV